MTDSPTARMIADAIEASGKSQREIATEMGYERPNVVSMMKNGDMRMPLERIPAFAAATGVDAELLLRTAMLEYMPATWEVVAASRRQTGPERAFPVQDAQINVRGPAPEIERFKQLCQAERRTYFDMLVQLMDIRDATLNRIVDEA
ncbi:ribbon-helix-helix protein [Roseivivax sediminis]|uniref:Helix-turn-helix domain-containing protein n=1 Tax=Roseivivax sediminis TaxID=936889 RepID=A0A1I2EGJ7_9RHOB|nr:XRE family transcriptional regulator [Roseivivax sediminis]SFE91813.1 Helix-turn-helix domain-containing protein [Roseivivax sediminis]